MRRRLTSLSHSRLKQTMTTVKLDVCHQQNVVEYIAGWVVRKLSPQIACGECFGALVVAANDSGDTDSLLVMKTNGGLVRPSAGVIAVVTLPKDVFRQLFNHFTNTQYKIDNHYTVLVKHVSRISEIAPLSCYQHYKLKTERSLRQAVTNKNDSVQKSVNPCVTCLQMPDDTEVELIRLLSVF